MPAESVPAGSPERVALADPALPIDPEHAARLLGEALRRRHGEPTGDGSALPSWPLHRLAAHVHTRVADSSSNDGGDSPQLMPDGPYRGRPVRRLASLLVETIDDLPGVPDGGGDDTMVAITLGLRLDVCVVEPSGIVVVDSSDRTTSALGDRHVDLAAAAIGLNERFGPAVVAPMVEAYGFDAVDPRRLDTAQLLVALAEVAGWPMSPESGS